MKTKLYISFNNNTRVRVIRFPQSAGDNDLTPDEELIIELYENRESYAKELVKDELTKFLDFLLKNGYCDSDVYSEPPSAIDRYMHPKLNQ